MNRNHANRPTKLTAADRLRLQNAPAKSFSFPLSRFLKIAAALVVAAYLISEFLP